MFKRRVGVYKHPRPVLWGPSQSWYSCGLQGHLSQDRQKDGYLASAHIINKKTMETWIIFLTKVWERLSKEIKSYLWLLLESEETMSKGTCPSLGAWRLFGLLHFWLCERAGKQHSSLASASVPTSRFLPCTPALTSLDDALQTVGWYKPCPSQIHFGHGVLPEQQKP